LGRIVNLNYIVQKIPRQRVDHSTRHALSGVDHAVRQTTQSNCPELTRAGPDWQEAHSFFPLSFQLAIRRWHQGARRAVQPKRLSAGARGNWDHVAGRDLGRPPATARRTSPTRSALSTSTCRRPSAAALIAERASRNPRRRHRPHATELRRALARRPRL